MVLLERIAGLAVLSWLSPGQVVSDRLGRRPRELSSPCARPNPMLTPKKPAILVTAAAILCFAGVYAEAAEIHDGDTGYIADNSIWFTNEPDLAVWMRVRQVFAPKDVRIYQHIILETRQAWQFISGPLKVKVISYWAKEHEINVKMLTKGRLADTEWWIDDKDYSSTKRSEDESAGFPPHRLIEAAQINSDAPATPGSREPPPRR